jgi:hypothetical protein
MAFDLSEAIEILERTPSVLNSLLQGLSEEWLDSREEEDAFSPKDVLGHLILGEKTDWVPRMRIILEKGEGTPFEPFDPHGFAAEMEGKSSGALLLEFQQLRVENLRYLIGLKLSKEDLDRTGTHPELGAVTLRQLLAMWAVHDLGHLVQISRTMAKRYREDVGPWRTYTRVLED